MLWALRLTRWRDWSHSKLPFVAGAALLAGAPTDQILLALPTIALWAAFGYGLNEIADRGQDDRHNHAAGLGRKRLALYLLATAAGALGSSLLWSNGVVVALGLALTVAYSAPPLRLKERGVAGVVSGAAAQWVLPVLAVAGARPVAVLAFVLGVRWMIVHQLHDAEHDRRANVRTFGAGDVDMERLLVFVFALEVVTLGVVLALSGSATALVALAPSVLWPRERAVGERLQSFVDPPLGVYYFCLLSAFLAFERESAAAVVLGVLVFVLGAPPLPRLRQARTAPS